MSGGLTIEQAKESWEAYRALNGLDAAMRLDAMRQGYFGGLPTSAGVASDILDQLVGDPAAMVEVGEEEVPFWRYLISLPLQDSYDLFMQVAQLPESERMRDLIERVGADGRAA